jgi:hypothetical protein
MYKVSPGYALTIEPAVYPPDAPVSLNDVPGAGGPPPAPHILYDIVASGLGVLKNIC